MFLYRLLDRSDAKTGIRNTLHLKESENWLRIKINITQRSVRCSYQIYQWWKKISKGIWKNTSSIHEFSFWVPSRGSIAGNFTLKNL